MGQWRRQLWKRLPRAWQTGLRRAQAEMYRRRFRGALGQPPQPTDPEAAVEIHTLLCRRDVLSYLYAVKSLLWRSGDFAVVVHDDGTLTCREARLLADHLPGVRVIERREADGLVLARLGGYGALGRYRRTIPNAIQLLDFWLLARRGKLISLDADVLFLDRPAELLEWAADARKLVLVGQEKGWQSEQDWRLAASGLEYFPNINIGLMCFDGELVPLERAEEIVAALGGEADWWTGQAAMAVLLADRVRRDARSVAYFDGDRYVHSTALDGPAVMKHYWAARRLPGYWRYYREDLKKIGGQARGAASRG